MCEGQRSSCMSLNTIVDVCVLSLSHRTLLALGCHVGMGDEKAEENLKKIKLPKTYDSKVIPACISWLSTRSLYLNINVSASSYVMTNGYKPAPLDLNHVKLTPNQNQLVEKLAENGHNVWARDRVRQGWTYSIVQVSILFLNFIKSFIYLLLFSKSSSQI